jgi:hypothetical protein
MKDAICCECQRTVANGAFLENRSGAYLMVKHPAAGVFIDVSKPDWKAEYIPAIHNSCRGVDTAPQHVFL